jgi:hypothetical protein
MRRFATAVVITLSMARLFSSAPSGGARTACAIIGAILVCAVLFIGRRAAPAQAPGAARAAQEDDDDDDTEDEELARGSAVRGGSLRSPGGTLVLTRRTLHFTHARGEIVLPVEQILRVETGRTLALFDNQIVLTMHDAPREVFQISEDRERWLEAFRTVLTTRRGAYR